MNVNAVADTSVDDDGGVASIPTVANTETKQQIRGSSLLAGGRLLAVLVACVTQILIVHYLSKRNYGAFEYALSVIAVGETAITFGLDRAVARFIPIYQEQGDRQRLQGTLLLGIGSVISLGSAILLLYYGFHTWLSGAVIDDETASSLLMIMVLLAPVQAMDNLLTGLFAVFASPGAIFFRKYLLGPGLRLAVVLILITRKCTLFFLGGGYLVSGILGVSLYLGILYRALKDQHLLEHVDFRSIRLPFREVMAFCGPILSGDIAVTLLLATDTLLLGYFQHTTSVAQFRVVQPTARLNQLVLMSFGLLFTPAASRMFARRDWASVNVLYWQTAIWMAVFSFPIFVLTFSLARPLTSILFGGRYIDSAPILAILSLGYYINAAFGANGTLLVVYGKTRYVVMTNVFTVILNLVLAFCLIPSHGPLGAALAIGITLIAANCVRQYGLRYCDGVQVFNWKCLRVYLIIGAATALLWVQSVAVHRSIVTLTCAALASVVVLYLNRHDLNVQQTFPEVTRFPLGRLFFSRPKPRPRHELEGA